MTIAGLLVVLFVGILLGFAAAMMCICFGMMCLKRYSLSNILKVILYGGSFRQNFLIIYYQHCYGMFKFFNTGVNNQGTLQQRSYI